MADASGDSDEALLGQIARVGSHAAFAELVRRHAGRYRAAAYRFVHSREEAEDIVQDAFLKLWRNPGMWDPSRQTSFTTWFYRIILNQCLDYKRRHKPVPFLDGEEFTDAAPLADAVLAERQQQWQVERAFRSLPQPMQTSLNLNFYEALPHREAASLMGMSLKAFQSLLMRAKSALRDKLAEEQPEARRYDTR